MSTRYLRPLLALLALCCASAHAGNIARLQLRASMRSAFTVILTFIFSLSCSVALAAYTRFQSSAVTIQTIYANELGSPFIVVSPTVNATCAGLYLYDISVATPSSAQLEYRKNKMAVLMTAMASGKQVTLDYYSDPSVPGWASCFIQGIQIVN
jgi:hypothetical protein